MSLLTGKCFDCRDDSKAGECESLIISTPKLVSIDEEKQEFSVAMSFEGPELTTADINSIVTRGLVTVESDYDMEVI